jgi:hypothetical protein
MGTSKNLLNAKLAQARGSLLSNMLTRAYACFALSWLQPVTVFRGTLI